MVEETIISQNIVRNSQFAETMNGKYTIGWQLIRIPSKTKDGHVQKFCSTHTIRPLAVADPGFQKGRFKHRYIARPYLIVAQQFFVIHAITSYLVHTCIY